MNWHIFNAILLTLASAGCIIGLKIFLKHRDDSEKELNTMNDLFDDNEDTIVFYSHGDENE